MANRNANAITAGGLYLIFAVFAAAILVGWWFMPPRFTLDGLMSTPGALELLLVISFLLLSSATLGGYLVAHAHANQFLLAASLGIACVGLLWNMVAMVFWLLPPFFIWRACHDKHDD
jgi:hypothetical protein